MLRTDNPLFIAAVTLLSIAIVKGPIERSLNVTPHSNTVGESIGIPMSIMSNALVNDPDNLPKDVHEFLNQIADDRDWREYYITGEWDSCKWEFGGIELLQDAHLSDILTKAAETIIACPQASYESIRENTRIFWQVIGDSTNWTADRCGNPTVPELQEEAQSGGEVITQTDRFAGYSLIVL